MGTSKIQKKIFEWKSGEARVICPRMFACPLSL